MTPQHRPRERPRVLPKILGADVELGNFVEGVTTGEGTGEFASEALLQQIEGIPSRAPRIDAGAVNPQDRARKFLATNGGCAYIDSHHLEIALPETRTAFDHLTWWRAMLLIARRAMHAANAQFPPEHPVRAFVNTSDGAGNSYGSHMNVLLSRRAWDDLFHHEPHYLPFLAAFQTSSIVFTGQGKAGRENNRPHVDFQISQRADFVETLVSDETMRARPIVNRRNEPLCGRGSAMWSSSAERPLARLHVIFYDSTLCQTATLLRAGTMQIVAAILEAGYVDASLTLRDPIAALHAWSCDPALETRAALTDGTMVTAVELQQRFLQLASTFVRGGHCGAAVPRAADILDLWADTLDKLAARDFEPLARRIDWILKKQLLDRVLSQRTNLSWQSPEIRHLDQLYADLDDATGLFWACERAGLTDRIVDDDTVNAAVDRPPGDTRAWTRATLLRLAGIDRVEEVDWDYLRISCRDASGAAERVTIHVPTPFAGSRASFDARFRQQHTIDDIIDQLTKEAHHETA